MHNLSTNYRHDSEESTRRSGLAWLLFLGPFFLISYSFANSLAAQNASAGEMVFAWEQAIPFLPWTIIPYWSIDLLYVGSLFICRNKIELDRHALRLLTAQLIAVSCFILFPLGFSFERPQSEGLYGALFNLLSQFDQPYNQAPSLHITLLVILWVLYARVLPKSLLLPLHILGGFIAVSVLTTYQHHFIDVPTGLLLGWLCVWLWPLEGDSMFSQISLRKDKRSWSIAMGYLVLAVVCAWLALTSGGAGLWLFWPVVSFCMVAINYSLLGEKGFQKNLRGQMSLAARVLLLPYLILAYINSRLWTLNKQKAVYLGEGVYLGRIPSGYDIRHNRYDAVIDLTAEFHRPGQKVVWHTLPGLDLVVPTRGTLLQAAKLIDDMQKRGSVLVSCALGYSRSALAVMAWMITTRRASTVDEAVNYIRNHRPEIVINHQARLRLSELI